jgi:serine/threonine protein kinase
MANAVTTQIKPLELDDISFEIGLKLGQNVYEGENLDTILDIFNMCSVDSGKASRAMDQYENIYCYYVRDNKFQVIHESDESAICLGLDRGSGKTIIIKKYNADIDCCEKAAKEATYLAWLSNKHGFPKYHGLMTGNDLFSFKILMEYIPFNNLHCQIPNGDIDLDATIKITRELINVIAFLLKHKKAHCDVKTTNLIWDTRAKVLRVFDVGLMQQFPSENEGFDIKEALQTADFRSPEVFLKTRFTAASDMWSVGCVIYELITGKVLFDVCSKSESFEVGVVSKIVGLLGIPPNEMLENGKDTGKYFTHKHDDIWELKEGMISEPPQTIRKLMEKEVGSKWDDRKEDLNNLITLTEKLISYDRLLPKQAQELVERMFPLSKKTS